MERKYGCPTAPVSILCLALAIPHLNAMVLDGSYHIVVPDKIDAGTGKYVYQAGRELAAALKEGAGLELKVLRQCNHKKGKAIYLGADAAEKAGLMPADLDGFANMIVENDGNIYLFGRDTQRRFADKSPAWIQCLLPTVKAVTRFMEKFMDVRFLGPGEVGKDIPEIGKVEVPDGFSSRQLPAHDYAPGRHDTLLYGYASDCFGSGKYCSYGGHTYPKACPPDKYFKDHPEYFGLVGGKRTCEPRRNPTLCISNPAIEDILVEELLRSMDAGQETVQLAQQDGTQWCECEECKRYGGPAADTVGEKLWILHRRVAERVLKLRPGKRVNIISYGPTATPPKTFKKFPANVMIEIAGSQEIRFRQWRDGGYEVPHGFVTYIYLWGNYPTMGFTAKHSYMHCAEVMRRFHRYGVRGVYRCGFGELFGMEGPAYYVFNRLIDDPDADVDKVVQEYCDRAYGPAAQPMRRFHDYLDKRLRGVDLIEDTRKFGVAGRGAEELSNAAPENPLELLAYAYPPDTVTKMRSCLAQAERLAETKKQKTRLALVRSEFDYAANLGKIATLYAAYRMEPSPETLAPLGKAIDERNAIMDRIYGGDTRPNAVPVKIPGWSEVRHFGRSPRSCMFTNGRLGATLRSPLGWDVKKMLAAGFLPGARRSECKVPRTEKAPDFADFDGGAWAAAEWCAIGGIQADTPRLAARFKVLAGPDALYLATESEMPPNARVVGVEHDGPCWREENFSLIVSPDDVATKYFHLIWNVGDDSRYESATGLKTDPLDPMFGKADVGWNGEWAAKNEMRDGKWRSLVTLPYATFGAARPESGTTWGFNLGRDANHTGKGSDKIYLLWSPNFENARSLESPNARGALKFL